MTRPAAHLSDTPFAALPCVRDDSPSSQRPYLSWRRSPWDLRHTPHTPRAESDALAAGFAYLLEGDSPSQFHLAGRVGLRVQDAPCGGRIQLQRTSFRP